MAGEFQYQPLDSPSQDIRLIDLIPSQDPTSPVHITLRHVRLTDHPEYCALSYTWGAPFDGLPPEWDSPDATRPIKINGKDFHVRLNLEAALRRLIRQGDGRPIWIDAICINQSDVAEKNAQVQNMGNLFAGAQVTFAWLGPDSHNSERLSEAISRWKERWDHGSEEPESLDSDSAITAFYDNVNAFAQFLSRNWFRRVWAVQEAVLSRELVLLWGDGNSSSFSWLMAAEMLLREYSRFPVRFVFESGCVSQRLHFDCLEDLRKRAAHFRLLCSAKLRFWTPESPLNLATLLADTGWFAASDPRDHVYALLGMLSDGGDIKVDYEPDVATVFTATFRRILEKDKNLYVLDFSGRRPSMQIDLPSWVPDISEPYNWPILGCGRATNYDPTKRIYYNAGGTVPPRLEFRNESVLVIMGVRVDTVSWLGDPSASDRVLGKRPRTNDSDLRIFKNEHEEQDSDGKAELSDLVRSWLNQWIADCRLQGRVVDISEPYTSTPECLAQAFIWTIRAGMTFRHGGHRIFTDANRGHINRALMAPASGCGGFGSLSLSLHQYLKTLRLTLANCLPGRTFVVTPGGYFCLVPREARFGDIIMVAFGAEVPYILRPNGQGQYTFLGQAYVHWIMDGEVMEMKGSSGAQLPVVPFEIISPVGEELILTLGVGSLNVLS